MNDHLFNFGFHRRCSKLVEVQCELGVSRKCKGKWKLRYSRAYDSIEKNGKVICLYCYRTSKFSGRGNPNCKYKTLDDDFFKEVNTQEKAYLLGWIAGDGTVQPEYHIEIVIHEKDVDILQSLRDIICKELKIWKKDDRFVGLRICSKQITEDVCSLLKIEPGKKSHTVQFPELNSDELKWCFVRGLFDADGCVVSPSKSVSRPSCCIASNSDDMLDAIEKFCDIKCCRANNRLTWNSTYCLRFLTKMYEGNSVCLNRKKRLYENWFDWKPSRECADNENSSFNANRTPSGR